MKIKNNKVKEEPVVYDTTPNQTPEIEVTLGDMLMTDEIIINGITYIWVDGYKGTNKDMQAYGNYQYRIGEPFLYEGTPQICAVGLHFCVDFEDVFSYYGFDFSNRFFKVRALVNKEDYLSYGIKKEIKHYIRPNGFVRNVPTYVQTHQGKIVKSQGIDENGVYYYEVSRVDKLSAKVIILTEEITKENYFDYNSISDILFKHWIESKEELLSISNFSKESIPEFLNSKFITKALKYYTPEFCKLFLEKYCNWDSITERANQLSHFIKVMEVCYKDGLSKDLTTTILLDEKL